MSGRKWKLGVGMLVKQLPGLGEDLFDVVVQVQPLVKDDLKVEWYWVCLRGLLW